MVLRSTSSGLSPTISNAYANRLFVVHSFGIVTWEIFSRRKPYDDQHLPEHMDNFIDYICRRGVRPTVPRGCPEFVERLMKSCWQREPANRPTFRTIVRQLNSLHKSDRE